MMLLRNQAVKLCNLCLLTMKKVIDILEPMRRHGKLAFYSTQTTFCIRLTQKYDIIAELEFDLEKYDISALVIVPK